CSARHEQCHTRTRTRPPGSPTRSRTGTRRRPAFATLTPADNRAKPARRPAFARGARGGARDALGRGGERSRGDATRTWCARRDPTKRYARGRVGGWPVRVPRRRCRELVRRCRELVSHGTRPAGAEWRGRRTPTRDGVEGRAGRI